MSMISEQIEQLEELKEIILKSTSPYYECVRRAQIIRSAVDTIKELSAKLRAASMERSAQYYNNGWIPLGDYDDPPAKNGIYEVTAYWHETWQTLQAEHIDGHWFVITRMGVLKDIPVEAWRYVAEPYQPKESEGNDE